MVLQLSKLDCFGQLRNRPFPNQCIFNYRLVSLSAHQISGGCQLISHTHLGHHEFPSERIFCTSKVNYSSNTRTPDGHVGYPSPPRTPEGVGNNDPNRNPLDTEDAVANSAGGPVTILRQ